MKKILAKLSDSLLSKEELRKIKGGYEDDGYGCTTHCWDYSAMKPMRCSYAWFGCYCEGGGGSGNICG